MYYSENEEKQICEFHKALRLKYQYISPIHKRNIDKTTETLIYSYGKTKCIIPNHIKYLIIYNRNMTPNIRIPYMWSFERSL